MSERATSLRGGAEERAALKERFLLPLTGR